MFLVSLEKNENERSVQHDLSNAERNKVVANLKHMHRETLQVFFITNSSVIPKCVGNNLLRKMK